jgi:hypothetical protein
MNDPSPDPVSPVGAGTAPVAAALAGSAIDLQSRVVNGILVIVVIAIVGLLYALQPSNAQGFGIFTTLVGTALSAYFGISATREISRSAVDNANTQAGDAREKAGQLKEQHDQLSSRLMAAQHADTIEKVRSILAPT